MAALVADSARCTWGDLPNSSSFSSPLPLVWLLFPCWWCPVCRWQDAMKVLFHTPGSTHLHNGHLLLFTALYTVNLCVVSG